MTSKPTVEERIEEIDIQIKLNKSYGVQYTAYASDGVLLALQARVRKLEREREKLLHPAPRIPRKQDSKQAVNAPAEGKVIPVPSGLQVSENAIGKRVRK